MQMQIRRRIKNMARRRYAGQRMYVIDALVVLAVLGSIGYAVYGGSPDDPYDCEKVGAQHRIQLTADKFSEESLAINRCDTLTIENKDSLAYDLNFGDHDRHVEYLGYQRTTLLPNESITIDAFQAGRYELHDHFRDNAVLKIDIRELRASD